MFLKKLEKGVKISEQFELKTKRLISTVMAYF
jgi:hypothetical protein